MNTDAKIPNGVSANQIQLHTKELHTKNVEGLHTRHGRKDVPTCANQQIQHITATGQLTKVM